MCKERGIECNKVWGPKRRQILGQQSPITDVDLPSLFRKPQPPEEERLTSSEWMEIREFHSLWPPLRYGPKLLESRFGSNVGIQLYNVPHLDSQSSNVYRTAILVIMSYLRGSSDTPSYHAKYRLAAQKYIDSDSIGEVVFASYVVAVYSLIGGDSVKFALKSCNEFCKSVVVLSKSRMICESWIELLWQDVLSSLYCVHRDAVLFQYSTSRQELTESLGRVQELLRTSRCLLPSGIDISNLPLSMTTEEICHKVKALAIYLQYYLDQFLFRATYDARTEGLRRMRADLCGILDRITRLIAHLSPISNYIYHAYPRQFNIGEDYSGLTTNAFLHFADVQPQGLKATAHPKDRDTALALLYAFARLLKNMLDPTVDEDENVISEIHDSAIAICRLCASFPGRSRMVTLLAKRSLFWAGLILTESKLGSGNVPLRFYSRNSPQLD